MKRIVTFAVACLLLISMIPFIASAAPPAATVSFSAPTANVGETVTATVSFFADNIGYAEATLTYNDALLEFLPAESENSTGGAGNIRLMAISGATSASVLTSQLRFRAKAAGKVTVAIQESSLYSMEDESLLGNPKTSAEITLRSITPLSSNTNLKSLTVGQGTLSPSFAKTVTAYSVNVSTETTRLVFSAVAEDAAAKVTTTGGTNLKIGVNTVNITVTAPNGNTKVYTLTVTRRDASTATTTSTTGGSTTDATTTTTEAPLTPSVITLPFGDADGLLLTVSTALPADMPLGCAPDVVIVDGVELPAYRHLAGGQILMAAFDSTVEAPVVQLYFYSELQRTLYDCLVQDAYIFLPAIATESVAVAPHGYILEPHELAGRAIPFWRNLSEELPIVYAVQKDGIAGYYCYDEQENTLQRFFPALGAKVDTSATTASVGTVTAQTGIYRRIVFIGAPIAGILFLVLIVLLVLSMRKNSHESQHNPQESRH